MINFPKRMKQLLDFETLRFNTIMPTDIDGVLDYHNVGFLFYEYKHAEKGMSSGQRLFLEHQVKTNIKAGKVCYAIVVEHYTNDVEEPVKTGYGKVRQVYDGTEWRPPKYAVTAREFTKAFLEMCVEREEKYKRNPAQ